MRPAFWGRQWSHPFRRQRQAGPRTLWVSTAGPARRAASHPETSRGARGPRKTGSAPAGPNPAAARTPARKDTRSRDQNAIAPLRAHERPGLRALPAPLNRAMLFLPRSISCPRGGGGNGPELASIQDVKDSIRGHRRAVDRAAYIVLSQNLQRLALLQDDHITVFVAEIHFPVRHEGRTPDRREHIVHPVRFSGLRIQAVQKAAEIRDVNQSVLDGCCRDRAADLGVMPQPPGVGGIARLAGIDAVHVPHTFAVLRILARG